jgi:predicted 3-demethylubiquinone-9 3-methyltransferase (glyoxalase superfamily)
MATIQKISPCLWFDSAAEEAAKFYVSVFSAIAKSTGSGTASKVTAVTHYGESGASIAGRPKGSVMTVVFELAGQEFMALNGGPLFTFSEAISFIVNCESQDEIDAFWQELSEGGETGECGWLTDKYGLSWQIVPTVLDEMIKDSDPKKSEQVMSALLKMTKLDIKRLKQAYDQK